MVLSLTALFMAWKFAFVVKVVGWLLKLDRAGWIVFTLLLIILAIVGRMLYLAFADDAASILSAVTKAALVVFVVPLIAVCIWALCHVTYNPYALHGDAGSVTAKSVPFWQRFSWKPRRPRKRPDDNEERRDDE